MSKKYFSQHKWNKESLLSFLHNHLVEKEDYQIVLDQGNELYINILTYNASHKLFGKGGMNKPLCWASHPYMWTYSLHYKNYKDRKHFFYFNFDLDKNDELAKIAFISGKRNEGSEVLIDAFTSNHSEIWCNTEWPENIDLLKKVNEKCRVPNDIDKYPIVNLSILFNIEKTINKEHVYGKFTRF